MAIDVLCPGCQKKFRVSDQFAGKKGPCPQCKTIITIPAKGPEVIIHAPETEGPKGSDGRPASSTCVSRFAMPASAQPPM